MGRQAARTGQPQGQLSAAKPLQALHRVPIFAVHQRRSDHGRRSRGAGGRVLLVHRGGVPRRRRREIGRKRLHRRRRPSIRPTSRSAAATPAMPRRSASPSTPSRSATPTCSTSSSRPTTRPSSTARAMTSAPSIARRSSRRTRSSSARPRAAIERANEEHGGRVVTTIEPTANGIRPRIITRIIGPARGRAIPIASRSSRPSWPKLRKSFQARVKAATAPA